MLGESRGREERKCSAEGQWGQRRRAFSCVSVLGPGGEGGDPGKFATTAIYSDSRRDTTLRAALCLIHRQGTGTWKLREEATYGIIKLVFIKTFLKGTCSAHSNVIKHVKSLWYKHVKNITPFVVLLHLE